MRTITATLVTIAAAPLLLSLSVPARADVTIRYKTETETPVAPGANVSSSSTIRMKGNKGASISDRETMIVDFARQEITILDTSRRKFATVPAAQYGDFMSVQMSDVMAQAGGAGAIQSAVQSMKTTCDSKNGGETEIIQGVRTEEREMTCSMSMAMPDSVKQAMPAMETKMVMRLWFASAAEKVRVPGLWQLSGYELWQNYFLNPTKALGKMSPPGMTEAFEALLKDQSATLRSSMEMSMRLPFPGAANNGVTTLMKMTSEVVELSTATLDDSLFAVPSDYIAEPIADVLRGITQASLTSAKEKTSAARTTTSIPASVKAYVPDLYPVVESAPVDASGGGVQGSVQMLVTIGVKGKVENAEVLAGPVELRKRAVDAVRARTFYPVLRNGVPVVAYTNQEVSFTDYSKAGAVPAGFEFTPEIAAAGARLSELEKAFPRSPEQEFADLEQDVGKDNPSRRYDRLNDLAVMAVKVGDNDKASAYATELLAAAQGDPKGWNYGNSIHNGHMVLGIVALRNGDITNADRELLNAGKTTGSPQLNSFGPNMMLASELLKKGERSTVLDYFEMCRTFWKSGAATLDAWGETVRNGGTPVFGVNLR
jgi:hypothetical protein